MTISYQIEIQYTNNMRITVEQKEIELDERILTELDNFHNNSESIYNDGNENRKSCFDIISIKDSSDMIKTNDLFSKLNIKLLTKEKYKKFLESSKDKTKETIDNNFLIKDSEGWRVQSHYIGYGMNVEDLEKCVNYIMNLP